MKRKLLVMVALVLMTTAVKDQGTKIGYTFLEYIVFNMPEMESINSDLETYYGQLQAQIQTKQKDLETKYQQLQQMAQQPNANQVVLQEKENEFLTLQDQLQKFSAQAEQAYGVKQAEKINPIYNKVQDAIEAVRKENGYAMIINSKAGASAGIVLASDESLNITELVFKKLGVPMPEQAPEESAAQTTGNGNN